jgi:hypothetical protein
MANICVNIALPIPNINQSLVDAGKCVNIPSEQDQVRSQVAAELVEAAVVLEVLAVVWEVFHNTL